MLKVHMNSTFWRIWSWYIPWLTPLHCPHAQQQSGQPSNSLSRAAACQRIALKSLQGQSLEGCCAKCCIMPGKMMQKTSTWQRYKRASRLPSKTHWETFLRETTGYPSVGQRTGNAVAQPWSTRTKSWHSSFFSATTLLLTLTGLQSLAMEAEGRWFPNVILCKHDKGSPV